MSFFKSLLKNVPAAASIAADGKASSEFSGFIDTGSYTFNAALSGTLFGGLPNNKITVLAGESSVGKSYFALGVMKAWMEANPTGLVFYFDTESAVTNQMLTDRGIDINRVAKVEPDTIEQFRESALAILVNYENAKDTERQPIFMVLDSLGNLSSNKEIRDTLEQKDSRDMTKAGLIRGAFRVLRLKLAKLGVPMIVTNHVYTVVGAYVPTSTMSGGMGLKYVSDCVVFLSKSKDKDETDKKTVIGNIIRIKMEKSRLSRENSQVDTRISYSGGLDRYAGLLEMAIASGLVKKLPKGIQWPGHEKAVYKKQIDADPTAFYTTEFLQQLDEVWVKPTFTYGTSADEVLDVSDFEEVDSE